MDREELVYLFVRSYMIHLKLKPSIEVLKRRCSGGRIGTRFLRPIGASLLKGANTAGTPCIEMGPRASSA